MNKKQEAFKFLRSIEGKVRSHRTRAMILRCNTGYSEKDCEKFVELYYGEVDRSRRQQAHEAHELTRAEEKEAQKKWGQDQRNNTLFKL